MLLACMSMHAAPMLLSCSGSTRVKGAPLAAWGPGCRRAVHWQKGVPANEASLQGSAAGARRRKSDRSESHGAARL